MPLSATHYTSSAFFIFFGPDGLHGLNNFAVEILDRMLEFFCRAKHELDKEPFEQPSGDVAVGLVIVLALFVYFFDFTLFCCKKDGLDIVLDKVRIDILPTIIDSIGRKVGQLQKGFDDVEASLDAPALAVYFREITVFEAFGIKQRGVVSNTSTSPAGSTTRMRR